MKVSVFKHWDRIRSSFWFLPTVLACGAVVLAGISHSWDGQVTAWLESTLGWSFTGGAEGATAVLSTIAGSMITIAGVVFSMTLVALTLTSSQLGPRMLRNFMRDTATQVVLGTFVATFLYCLVVLRSIRHDEQSLFVPHLSVSLGLILAVVSIGVLIYFIHHVSLSIQANQIVARVSTELMEGIDRLYPESPDEQQKDFSGDSGASEPADASEHETFLLPAKTDGYLQFIEVEALVSLAEAHDLVVRLKRRPGQFVVAGQTLATVSPNQRMTEETIAALEAAFTFGHERTPGQDIEHSVNKLVEIAVRALSPGLNDPFTAIACIDHLGAALCRLASRDLPPHWHRGSQRDPNRGPDRPEGAACRLMIPVVAFPAIANTAFDQIRQYGRSSVAVTLRLLETICVVAPFAKRPEDVAALQRQADMIARGSRQGLPESEDRLAVEERYRAAKQALSSVA